MIDSGLCMLVFSFHIGEGSIRITGISVDGTTSWQARYSKNGQIQCFDPGGIGVRAGGLQLQTRAKPLFCGKS